MNFMTSVVLSNVDIIPGIIVYIPFWIVQEYLDISPPDPFIKGTVITVGRKVLQSPDGPVDGLVCDLDLGKGGLVAYSIPVGYVITEDQLGEWAERIAKWFSDFPQKINK